jgi:hypothetical protein
VIDQAGHLCQLPFDHRPRVVAGPGARLRRHHPQRGEAGVQRLAHFVGDEGQEFVLAAIGSGARTGTIARLFTNVGR